MPTYCMNCGAENRPAARFCHQCGGNLAADTKVAVTDPGPVATITEGIPSGSLVDHTLVSTPEPAASAIDTTDVALSSAEILSDEEPAAAVVQSDLSADPPPFDPEDIQPFAVAEDPLTPSMEAPDTLIPMAPMHAGAMYAVGALIANRYRIIAVFPSDDSSEAYTVEDYGVCPACGAAVQASEDEPYCVECGAYLLETATPRAQCILYRLPTATAIPGDAATVTWDGQSFIVAAAADMEHNDGLAPAPFPHGVQLLAGQRSDVGILRAASADEDSLFSLTLTSIYDSTARPTLGLYFVADGMGGHGDGEIASRIVSETVADTLLTTLVLPLFRGQTMNPDVIGLAMDDAIQSANARLIEEARARGNDMGTTLTMALVVDDQVYVANVGDSRTYFWHEGELRQVTEDHSAVYQLYRKGILTEQEIYTHPRRNEITRSMGLRGDVQVDYFRETLAPGDALLLCCDGLWEMLHNDGIADVLLTDYGNPQVLCDELIKRANQAGGEDNISVILVRTLG